MISPAQTALDGQIQRVGAVELHQNFRGIPGVQQGGEGLPAGEYLPPGGQGTGVTAPAGIGVDFRHGPENCVQYALGLGAAGGGVVEINHGTKASFTPAGAAA